MPEIHASAQIAVSKTFVMAHLLTASIDQAEAACREAIDAWNPDVEGDETLLRSGVAAALRTKLGPIPARLNNSLSGGSYLPAELQAVLDPNQPSEIVEFTSDGKFVAEFSLDPSNSGAFGIAIANLGSALRIATVDDNQNNLTT